jgi:preprotein translocase subunit SecD
MNKMSRFIIWLITIGISVWFLTPTVQWYQFIPEKDKELLKMSQDQLDVQTAELKKKVIELKKIRKKIINLGLDLQGGVNITLQINEDNLKQQMLEKFDYDQKKVDDAFPAELKNSSERALEVLKNRMDQFGVSEPTIRRTTEGRISIELPGMDNPQQIRDALSKVGRLEFRIVDEKTMKKLQTSGVNMTHGYVVSRQEVPADFQIPDDSEWVASWKNDEFGIPKLDGWYVLKKKVELDGTMVKTARSDVDTRSNQPKVDFELTSEGADVFGEVTAANIDNRLAIVLDGKIKSAPNIRGEISGGTGEITGDFTLEETVFLANVLKAGALPVKLDIVQERVIGATLGSDSISQTSFSLLIGSLLVVVFMILYYKTSGFISIIALSFHVLYLLALLAGTPGGATLTLSGIAGIALTIGMAVDSNVIIYERIREELRRSTTYRRALENGYAHASTTIWDSNLTTLMAAIVLLVLGEGTVKGFGLTLFYGIGTNIFASLFLSRFIFDVWMDTFKPVKISV